MRYNKKASNDTKYCSQKIEMVDGENEWKYSDLQ